MTDHLTPTPEPLTEPAYLARRDLIVLLVGAACLQALAWAGLLALFSAGWMGYDLHQLGDTLLYQFYGVRFAMGHWPYADVPVEYPPLANLVFLVAPSGGSVAEYDRWFSTAMIVATTGAAVLTTAAAAVIWRSLGRALAAAAVYAGLTLACGSLAINRYDAVVALVVASALLFLAVGRRLPATISLGLGFALKLTPALLFPVILLLERSRRRIGYLFAAFLLAAVVPFVPFLIHDPGSVAYPFTYHSARPLQMESVPGTPWIIAALTSGAKPRVVSSYGSQNFTGGPADLMAAVSPWLLLLTVAAVYFLLWRRREALRHRPEFVPVAALAVLLVAVCTSKVLSPQFLIWTFPVVALAVVQRSRLAKASGVACLVAIALTQMEFPARYWRLVALDPGPLALVAGRNAVLLLAAVLAVLAVTGVAPGPVDATIAAGTDAPKSPTSRS
jgi:hypothetical protein